MKRSFYFALQGIVILIVFILVTNAGIRLTTKSYIYDDERQIPMTEVAIIPGAAILSDGSLSSIFTDRADMAVKLYKDRKVSKILVSGDNSTVSHNEVDPVRRYLISKGIPEEDIFLDHAGFDTYSTMYRARHIFGVTSVIIASQSFHLPRAVFLAHALRLQAYGANADAGHILLRNYIREVFSDEKAVLDLAVHRSPKFLGDRIPITGDGRNYP